MMMPFSCFLVFFALYAGAAFPTFGTDLQAELMAAAASGGVPPPPAQFIAWLLAKLSFLVPFGSPSYRVNLLAAALMAGTVPMVAGMLERLAPAKGWTPFAHQELEQERWRATARWLTAFMWGLSPGPWRCALHFGPDTVGLFLTLLAFRAAADGGIRAAFLSGLAVGQWPAAVLGVPGMILIRVATAEKGVFPPPAGKRSRWTVHRTLAFLAGFSPALGVLVLSRLHPGLDNGAPVAFLDWIRQASTWAPFFPSSPGSSFFLTGKNSLWILLSLVTLPGALLWGFGFYRLARERPLLFQAALLTVLLAGPLLFLSSRPLLEASSTAQASAWGLCALGLSVPFLWGTHRAGIRFPATRTALAVLLPLSLAGRISTASRNDTSLMARSQNIQKGLPAGALLWNPSQPGALFYARWVDGKRADLRIARQPSAAWARTEYRRRHPGSGGPAAAVLSKDLFFLDIAREAGPENVFTDGPFRLPGVDPGTGLAVGGRFPEDAIPLGPVFHFLPATSHRLVAPAAQLSLTRLPLWACRGEDRDGMARARMALSQKFDQFDLSAEAEEEAWAALGYDPGLPEAHRRLAEAALQREDAERASIHLSRALERSPLQPDLWALQARAASAQMDFPRAIRSAEQTLRLNPDRDDVRQLLAETFERTEQPLAAAQTWKSLMNRRPENAQFVWRLAWNEAEAGRTERALAALREYMLFPLSPEDRDRAEQFENRLKGSL